MFGTWKGVGLTDRERWLVRSGGGLHNDRARTVACVHGGYAIVAHPFDQRLVSVVRIDRPQVRLQRRRLLQLVLVAHLTFAAPIDARKPDGRMYIYQSWCDHLGFEYANAVGYSDA